MEGNETLSVLAYHLLGIMCLLGIILSAWLIVKKSKRISRRRTAFSVVAGVFCFIFGLGLLLLLEFKYNFLLPEFIYNNTSVVQRIYFLFAFISFILIIISKIFIHFLQNHIEHNVVLAVVLTLNMLITLQPIGYKWLETIFSLK